MNETHFAVVATWIAAVIAFGCRWYSAERVFQRAADSTMLAVIISLSVIAWNHPLPGFPRIAVPLEAGEHVVSLMGRDVNNAPVFADVAKTQATPKLDFFVGEVGGHLYHKTTCERLLSNPVVMRFETELEAKDFGRSGCVDCIGYPKP